MQHFHPSGVPESLAAVVSSGRDDQLPQPAFPPVVYHYQHVKEAHVISSAADTDRSRRDAAQRQLWRVLDDCTSGSAGLSFLQNTVKAFGPTLSKTEAFSGRVAEAVALRLQSAAVVHERSTAFRCARACIVLAALSSMLKSSHGDTLDASSAGFVRFFGMSCCCRYAYYAHPHGHGGRHGRFRARCR